MSQTDDLDDRLTSFKQDETIIHRRRERTAEKARLIYKWSLRITAAGSLLVLVGLFICAWYFSLDDIQTALIRVKPKLAAWRIVLFIIIVGGWPSWCISYRRWADLSDWQYHQMLKWRWRVGVWLILFEAVFTHNVIGKFFDSFNL
jgi:hypothetical protein